MRAKNITWKLTRPEAILAIKKEQEISLGYAKEIYEKLDEYVDGGVGILFPDNFYTRLKYINVIDFIDIDDDENKQRVLQEKRLAKAEKWLSTLTIKEQAMVRTLIDSEKLIARG